MDHDEFQALEEAVKAGGKNLGIKQITGSTGTAAKELVGRLCEDKLLDKKSSKYNLTIKGKEEWKRNAPPGRLEEIEDLQREQFLSEVQKKAGKAFTKPQLDKFSSEVPQEALDKGFIQNGQKARSYHLLPAGEAFLYARKIKLLESQKEQTISQWRESQTRLQNEVEEFASESGELRAAASQMDGRIQKATAAFQEVVKELNGFSLLLGAARQLQDAITGTIRRAGEDLQQKGEKLDELKKEIDQANETKKQELMALDTQVSERIQELSEKLKEITTKTDSPPVHSGESTNGKPSDDDVWAATKRRHAELRKETSRYGGFVKVPELTDKVRHDYSALTQSEFHGLLQKWHKEGRLNLQVCVDANREPRADEGISSPRGLLFYVSMD